MGVGFHRASKAIKDQAGIVFVVKRLQNLELALRVWERKCKHVAITLNSTTLYTLRSQ